MNDQNVQFMLGNIHARLDAGERDRVEIKETLESQNAKLDTIVRYIERQKGERRTLFAVGGTLATVAGTLAGFVVSWFTSTRG